MNIDRAVSVGALLIAIASAIFSTMQKQNTLEFMTKADFNTFQVQNVQKMTSLEATITNGFFSVGQQISSLQFVPTKDFIEFKEQSTKTGYTVQKEIDFVKKDILALEKNIEVLNGSVATQNARLNTLLDALAKSNGIDKR